jgi:hypothetical protein
VAKDIFVDTNIAKNFSNPLSDEYKNFIAWLNETGSLVISNKLLAEYGRSFAHSLSSTSMWVIINHLTRTGRLIKISSAQLDALIIPKRVQRRLESNFADHVHLKTVLLSNRKLAVVGDKRLRDDINNYPGGGASAAACPSALSYQ